LANLGNIGYFQKKFTEAIAYYQRALTQKADDKIALIGLARTQYEAENYSEVDRIYALVQQVDLQMARQYSYLVSRTEGAARAASSSESAGKAPWSNE